MSVLKYMADFFSGLWLWNMTWDWYHVPINIVMLWILLNIFAHMNVVKSLVVSVLSHLFAYLFFSLIAVGLITHLFNYTYNPQILSYVPTPAHACFYLGLIYSAFQILFLIMINLKYRIHLFTASMVIFVSNCLSAGIAYWLLPIM